MSATDVSIETLARTWLDAKREEDEAIARRRSIGKLIEEAIPGAPEGASSSRLGDIKITVTRKVTRSVDGVKLQKAWEFIPENVQKSFRWKAELVTSHFRALQELGAAELAEASEFITSKPASASVDVELIDQPKE